MFKKILIANRGEIACRVIKTAQKMGIQTVAVFSDADARSLHVEMADEAVNIGPAAASESYLVIEKIIAVCKQTGAEAVHPGYGFLSERSAFPKALAEAGLVFIGPNPYAIDAMGDKIESKKAAAAAGVSTVPGHMGIIESVDEAVIIAENIGYPVMIKASAGGGGKGMRIAFNAAECREGFGLAKAEAKSSFGDDRLFIEKFITNPRHIEIQVLGDKHGNVIYLGERECSIQRRNQKVIEEAPSPLLSEATRKKMGEQAVALAKAVNYDSAGTVEFVAGQDQSFYFLEMNTRLQVEHPVTELITGVDLVEQMIRVAYGEKLQLQQTDVKLNGWAVESRIYAEDPYRNFSPSTGRLIKYQPPQEQISGGVTVRNDTGVYEGGEISIWYDPMIAKLCTHAPTRAEAIAAMSHALDSFVIEGIQHNIPFVSAIMDNPRWQTGVLSTGFIGEEFAGGFVGVALNTQNQHALAEIAVLLDHIENTRKREISGQLNGRKVAFSRSRHVRLNKQWIELDVTDAMDRAAELAIWQTGQQLVSFTTSAGPLTVQVRPLINGYRLLWRGVSVEAHVYTAREAELARLMPEKKIADTSKKLLCPMPGLVVSLAVHEGQDVKAGDTLAVVEAMKMQNVLRAERDVTVKKINAKAGESLGVDAVIMEFT
jgi:propionyl-CoA carboxylase alpha chain